jgi:hypothetical protein
MQARHRSSRYRHDTEAVDVGNTGTGTLARHISYRFRQDTKSVGAGIALKQQMQARH